MTDLPRGWQLTTLDEIAEVRLGRQRSPKNHSGANMRPYLRAANVGWLGLKLGDVKQMNFTDDEVETYRLRAGDIVLSEASGSPDEVGKPALWNDEIDDCCFQNTLIRVRSHGPDPRFLLHFLRGEALRGAFVEHSRGVGIHHIGAARLAKWPVPVPPLAEQRRIIAELEGLLSRIDTASQAQQSLDSKSGALIQILISSALDGGMDGSAATDRGLPLRADQVTPSCLPLPVTYRLPRHWRVARLDELVSVGRKPAYGVLVPGPHTPGGTPLVRIGDLDRGRVLSAELKEIDKTIAAKYPRTMLSGGELLLSLVGTIGRVAVVPSHLAGANVARAIGVFPLDDQVVNPRWALLAISSRMLQTLLARAANEVARPTLNLEDARRCPIPLPPRDVQDRLVDELENRIAGVWRLKDSLRGLRTKGKSLRAALLAEAFAGRLVPQDPNDEPASELLARIRAERAAAVPVKRARAARAPRTRKELAAPPTRVTGDNYEQGALPL